MAALTRGGDTVNQGAARSPDPVRLWQQMQAVPRAGGSRRDVLVVDDDPLTRESLAAMLGQLGYSAAGVASGREALEYLEAHEAPSFILLDLKMPGMTGWAFRLALEKMPALARLPIVVCSGHAET